MSITRRDYFIGKAIEGLLSGDWKASHSRCAEIALDIADILVAAESSTDEPIWHLLEDYKPQNDGHYFVCFSKSYRHKNPVVTIGRFVSGSWYIHDFYKLPKYWREIELPPAPTIEDK